MKKTRKEGKKEGRRKEGKKEGGGRGKRMVEGEVEQRVAYVRKHYDLGIPYSSKFSQVFNFAKF